jgi:hypothetical protein
LSGRFTSANMRLKTYFRRCGCWRNANYPMSKTVGSLSYLP